jgi:hypothetical protein
MRSEASLALRTEAYIVMGTAGTCELWRLGSLGLVSSLFLANRRASGETAHTVRRVRTPHKRRPRTPRSNQADPEPAHAKSLTPPRPSPDWDAGKFPVPFSAAAALALSSHGVSLYFRFEPRAPGQPDKKTDPCALFANIVCQYRPRAERLEENSQRTSIAPPKGARFS